MSFVFQHKEFLRLEEAAQVLRVTRRSVEIWIQKGKLGYITTPSGRRLIPRLLVYGATQNYG